MNKHRRIMIASAAAALTAAAVYPLIFCAIVGMIVEPKDYLNTAILSGLVFGYALLVTAAHMVVLGLPAVLLLQKYNALNLKTIALAGFVAGGVPAACLNVEFAPWTGLLGIAGALSFWAVWSRPVLESA